MAVCARGLTNACGGARCEVVAGDRLTARAWGGPVESTLKVDYAVTFAGNGCPSSSRTGPPTQPGQKARDTGRHRRAPGGWRVVSARASVRDHHGQYRVAADVCSECEAHSRAAGRGGKPGGGRAQRRGRPSTTKFWSILVPGAAGARLRRGHCTITRWRENNSDAGAPHNLATG